MSPVVTFCCPGQLRQQKVLGQQGGCGSCYDWEESYLVLVHPKENYNGRYIYRDARNEHSVLRMYRVAFNYSVEKSTI